LLYSDCFLFSVPAQKAKIVSIRLKPGDRQGEFLGEAKSTGTTIFIVKVRKGQTFEAAAVIQSNDSKMSGEFYVKNRNGSIDKYSITQGEGAFSNQFSGYADIDETFYFKITEKPNAKFKFGVLVKNL